jgi:hypothetical protein
MENDFSDNNLILAGIFFYKGVCYNNLSDKDTAQEYWQKSKDLYLNIFDGSHTIILKLNELLEY